jgi:hypothetical protein
MVGGPGQTRVTMVQIAHSRRRSTVRRGFPFIVGFGFGFAIIGSTIASVALFLIGVGGHVLARRDDGAARIISFDPSTVAARAPFPAAVAVVLTVFFVAIFVRLGRSQKRFKRTAPKA